MPISRAAFSDSWTRHYSSWLIRQRCCVHAGSASSPSTRFLCVMTVLLKPVGTIPGPQMTRYPRVRELA